MDSLLVARDESLPETADQDEDWRWRSSHLNTFSEFIHIILERNNAVISSVKTANNLVNVFRTIQMGNIWETLKENREKIEIKWSAQKLPK